MFCVPTKEKGHVVLHHNRAWFNVRKYFLDVNVPLVISRSACKVQPAEAQLPLLSPSAETFFVQNQSLNYLHGSMGHSYKCREKQTLDVAPNFLINTFQVQVQPFGLSGDHFSAGKRRRRCQDLKRLFVLVPGVNPLLVASVFQPRSVSWTRTTC